MGKLSLFITILGFFSALSAFAATCDCDVRVYHPTTVSQKLKSASMKTYQLQTFDKITPRAQMKCRASCLKEFHKDMPTERLTALLITLSQRLVDEGVAGFNCTGLTTFKYPVRVKASLGGMGLGNVADQTEVITHEQACF